MTATETNQWMWDRMCVCLIIGYMQDLDSTLETQQVAILQLKNRGLTVDLEELKEPVEEDCGCY